MTIRTAFGMMLLCSTTLALCPPALAQHTARSAPVADVELAKAVDAVAAKALADKLTAGLAVAVVTDGRVRLARGYGSANLELNVPVTERTVFRIGSVTKEFTAAAILLLAEQGKLSIDDPVSKYLPEFPRGSEVTLRNLLNHTSGIHNYTALDDFLPAASRTEHSTDQMVEVIRTMNPLYDFEPGTSWSYSNSGFFLLGAIIEKVSGQSYPDFLQANVLGPAGLTDTRPDDLAEIVPGRASGYEKAKDAPTGFINAPYISISVAAAAGAMRSTVGDLAKWHDALLSGRLLKPASLALLLAPGRLKDGRLASAARPAQPGQVDPPADYGFGISTSRRDGRRVVGHGGAINGFNASLNTYPDEKTTIVLLTNTGGGTAGLSGELTKAVFGAAPPSAPSSR